MSVRSPERIHQTRETTIPFGPISKYGFYGQICGDPLGRSIQAHGRCGDNPQITDKSCNPGARRLLNAAGQREHSRVGVEGPDRLERRVESPRDAKGELKIRGVFSSLDGDDRLARRADALGEFNLRESRFAPMLADAIGDLSLGDDATHLGLPHCSMSNIFYIRRNRPICPLFAARICLNHGKSRVFYQKSRFAILHFRAGRGIYCSKIACPLWTQAAPAVECA